MKFINTALLAVIAAAMCVCAWHVRALDNRSAFARLEKELESVKSSSREVRRGILTEEAAFFGEHDPTYPKILDWWLGLEEKFGRDSESKTSSNGGNP